MSDLISRQAALEAVEKAATKECARWLIQELPKANVEKHGKWKTYKTSVPGRGFYYCTICRCDVYNISKYCPNCGARMDEVSE